MDDTTYRTHRRFDRAARLLGEDAMRRLAGARVMVVGLGGVGSFAAQRALRERPRGRAAPWWAVGHFVERGVLSPGGGRVRAAGQALPVGVLISPLRVMAILRGAGVERLGIVTDPATSQ